MPLKGFYSFVNKDFLFPQTDHKTILFQKGYVIVDSVWLAKESNKNHVLLYQDNNLIKDLSSSVITKSAFSIESNFPIVTEDFFFQSVSDRNLPIAWAVYIDESNNIIHIARDFFGNIPLYYIHIPNSFVAFATSIPSLLTIPGVKENLQGLNYSRAANFLNGTFKGEKIYNSSTIYSNINSALPSYVTSFGIDGKKEELYNHYNPSKWNILSSIEEYGEVFKDLFVKSIRREINDINVVGSHLSGGLDSSSICCMVREQNSTVPLHSFFNSTNTNYTDESDYATEVVKKIQSTHHIVSGSGNELDSVILNTLLNGQPDQMMSGSAMHNSVISQASNFKCQVLLTGYDGDGIVGYGSEYITQLYKEANWSKLRIVLEDSARHRVLIDKGDFEDSFESRKKYVFSFHLYKWLSTSIKSGSINNAINLLNVAHKYFGISPSILLSRGIKAFTNYSLNTSPSSILSAELLNVIASQSTIKYSQEHNLFYNNILFDVSIRFIEQMYINGKQSNVSIRHPFYDMDLYELCLAVPPEIKYGTAGKSRAHLREAMKNILPEKVRSRNDKATFDISVRNSTIRQFEQARDFLPEYGQIWDFVDKKKFIKAKDTLYSSHKDAQKIYYPMSIFVSQAVLFAIWLNYNKTYV